MADYSILPHVALRDVQDGRTFVLDALARKESLVVEGIDASLVERTYLEMRRFFTPARALREKFDASSFSVYGEWYYSTEYFPDERTLREIFFVSGLGLASFPWSLSQDFPSLDEALLQLFEAYFSLSCALPKAHSPFLHGFYYHRSLRAEERVFEHKDSEYAFAFFPQGEALEIVSPFGDGNEWVDGQLRKDEALLLPPGVIHRVRRLTSRKRYSLLMGYKTT